MYVYQIKNTVNNRIYIGSTKNFKTRKNKHLNDLRKNKHHSYLLQRAYNKHGEARFEFSVLEKTDSEKVVGREQHYIDTLKPFYNILKTVNTFSVPTPEGRERIAQASRRPINQFSLDGTFIRTWKSIAEASKALGIHEGSISWMCRGKYKQVGGFIFKYVDEDYSYNPAYKKVSKEVRRANHQKGAAKTYKIEKGNGEVLIVTNLREYCAQQNLTYSTVCSCVSRNGRYKDLNITLIKGRVKK